MTIQAILLLGPTGSGKTPLGDAIEACGLWGRRCVHFDFGACLRAVTVAEKPRGKLGTEELAVVRRVLRDGTLLEDHEFAIAEKILVAFLDERRVDAHTLVVLNGLPRHAGQAEAVDRLLTVRAVVHLVCSAEVVGERILTDAGADRSGRSDDSLEEIRRRLETFSQRTLALAEHYRLHAVPIMAVEVGPATSAEEMRQALESRPPA